MAVGLSHKSSGVKSRHLCADTNSKLGQLVKDKRGRESWLNSIEAHIC